VYVCMCVWRERESDQDQNTLDAETGRIKKDQILQSLAARHVSAIVF
jgi:hypothetical protein